VSAWRRQGAGSGWRRSWPIAAVLAGVAITLAASGCGGGPSEENRSTVATEDPEKAAEAKQAAEAALSEARKAEAAAAGNLEIEPEP